MTTIHKFALAAGFVGLSGVTSLLAVSALPDHLVTHWNAAGEPDGTMPKTLALALIPVLSAVLLALFAVLPRIDPRREKFSEFRFSDDWFVVVFAGYMLLVHAGVIAFNLGYGSTSRFCSLWRSPAYSTVIQRECPEARPRR